MIVVLDTNVWVSALLSPAGAPAQLVQLWEQEAFEIAFSPALLAELINTLAYPRVQKYLRRSPQYMETFLKRLKLVGIFVEPEVHLEAIPHDPDDNRVLECAATATAGYIISGDKHLLELKAYRGIVVLPPAGFLALLTTL